MFLTFTGRPSDSPFVERVWRSQSHAAGVFLSVATSHVEIAVTRHEGRTFLTVRGPETKATPADCPAGVSGLASVSGWVRSCPGSPPATSRIDTI